MKNKKWLIVPLLVIIVAVIWYVSATQWTRDLDLRYVDYVSGGLTASSDNSYYLYEITNNTHRTLKDVSVVIKVDTRYGDFKYEDSVSFRIKPGETVEYKLYGRDYKNEAIDRDIELGFLSISSVDIVKIKYSK